MLKLMNEYDRAIWVSPGHVVAITEAGQGLAAMELSTGASLVVRGDAEDVVGLLRDAVVALALDIGRATAKGATEA